MAGVAGWVSPGGVSRVRGQALPPSTAPLRNARRHGLGRRDLAKRISFALLLQMQWPARGGHARAAGLDATSTGTTREQGGHGHRPSNLASVPLVRATCRPAPEPSGRRGSRSALFAGMLEVPRVDVCDIWLAHGQGVPTRIRGTASGSLQEKSAWACR